MITSVGLVHLNVIDMERAIGFYVETLGMSLEKRHTPEWTSLRLDGHHIGLLKMIEPTPYIQRSFFGSRAGATLTLASDDIEADRQRIEAAGVTIIHEGMYPWGHCLVFEDTEGNVLRLMKDSAKGSEGA